MKATQLVTVEEHEIGTEDRVFFGHRDHDGQGNPLTAGQRSGWYWQARGASDCWGPFHTREAAEADYAAT